MCGCKLILWNSYTFLIWSHIWFCFRLLWKKVNNTVAVCDLNHCGMKRIRSSHAWILMNEARDISIAWHFNCLFRSWNSVAEFNEWLLFLFYWSILFIFQTDELHFHLIYFLLVLVHANRRVRTWNPIIKRIWIWSSIAKIFILRIFEKWQNLILR